MYFPLNIAVKPQKYLLNTTNPFSLVKRNTNNDRWFGIGATHYLSFRPTNWHKLRSSVCPAHEMVKDTLTETFSVSIHGVHLKLMFRCLVSTRAEERIHTRGDETEEASQMPISEQEHRISISDPPSKSMEY